MKNLFPDKKSCTDWLTALNEAITDDPDIVPPGWFTVRQIMAQLGRKDYDRLQERLCRSVKAGRMERKKFKIANSAGQIQPIYHYQIKK